VINTQNTGKSLLLGSSELARYEADREVLINWAQRNLSRKEKLPEATERFRRMNPDHLHAMQFGLL
jgi:hypothetical protein